MTIKPRLKERSCRGCKERFMQERHGQAVCTPKCAMDVARFKREKAEMQKRLDERKKTRAELEALKTLKELRAEAQEAFRWYIRMRDKAAGHGCICCGKPLEWSSTKLGGAVDAGHYISRGSAPELAFDERNTSAQAKGCNRPGGTTRERFRAGMVARWGEGVVSELEGHHEMQHLKHDDYRAMRAEYRRRARELEKQIAVQG